MNRSLKNYANKIIIGFAVAPLLFCLNIASAAEPSGSSAAHAIRTVPGMPPVVNPNNPLRHDPERLACALLDLYEEKRSRHGVPAGQANGRLAHHS